MILIVPTVYTTLKVPTARMGLLQVQSLHTQGFSCTDLLKEAAYLA